MRRSRPRRTASQCKPQLRGDGQFAGEDIDRPQRQHRKPRPLESLRHIPDAVKHFVHGPVAARSDHHLEPFPDRLRGQPARVSRGRSQLERALRADLIQVTPKAPGLFASGHRIEDDARPHTPLLGPVDMDSRGETVVRIDLARPCGEPSRCLPPRSRRCLRIRQLVGSRYEPRLPAHASTPGAGHGFPGTDLNA